MLLISCSCIITLLIPFAASAPQEQPNQPLITKINSSDPLTGLKNPVPVFYTPTNPQAPGACVHRLCHPLERCVASPANPDGLCVKDPQAPTCYALGCEFH